MSELYYSRQLVKGLIRDSLSMRDTTLEMKDYSELCSKTHPDTIAVRNIYYTGQIKVYWFGKK